MSPRLSKLLNLSVRAATLGSRFLFVFFLAKLLSPEELGLYGLVTASVGYALYLVGLDFYTFTTRELVNTERSEWGFVLKNQAALSLLLYAVVLPLGLLVFVADLLPWHVAKWFFVLIVLEHVCQELGRLFVAVNEQLFASILLFLRQGSWAIVATAIMLLASGVRSLDTVFLTWVVAGILAVGMGFLKLHKLRIGGWQRRVDWGWIVKGVKIAVPLLVATLALRGVFTVDRYWLQSLVDLSAVGAYVLFIGISGTLMAFLDAGVFAYQYPAMIKSFHSGKAEDFKVQVRLMVKHTVVAIVGFSLISLLVLPFLLDWIGNPVYERYQHLYPWLLLAMVLNGLGMIPHYALYAQKQDRPIVHSHIWSLPVFYMVTFLVSRQSPMLAVPLGLCASQAFILLWKAAVFYRVTPVSFRWPAVAKA